MSLPGRVLVVDDSEAWRQHLCSAIQRAPRWQIIAEVSDGLEAVQKAVVLKPDLILLDIGLPALNGIEAARRILALEPSSRILFLSEQQSWDTVEAALGTGALGYVVKSDAGRELLPAMAAVADGKQFIGARFAGRVFENKPS